MIQGTMSNVGKSLIAAGLCRVFAQDGYRVAPFKSQNMALNSYVTEEGLEMGRAQVVQAEACGRKPSVRMNPVLLKPTTDVGSQVIVMGKVRANMKAVDYFQYKKELVPEILEAYQRLDRENDIIVIEGAGSPAEINLKSDDIVNMGLAKMVDAPVLLVGDIDRGGVFAQLAGTVMLLDEDERQRICGMIINKFRGDVSILEPGLQMIEEICGKPILGVVPYERLDIEDEDSLSERLEKKRFELKKDEELINRNIKSEQDEEQEYKIKRNQNGWRERSGSRKQYDGFETEGKGQKEERGFVDVAVIRLPRISNFTDFGALEAADGARVRYADAPSELARADIIVLPGSKSTMSDLAWLRRTGLAEQIVRRGRSGAVVIGICGGYQMLGNSIVDMTCTESEHPVQAAALGLLPVDTYFESGKKLRQTAGIIEIPDGPLSALSQISVRGYEIHMGRSVIQPEYSQVCYQLPACGCTMGSVLGTYLHGIFDSREFTEALLQIAARRKGLNPDNFHVPDRIAYKEAQYDRLAAIIRQSLDIHRIYEIMGLK